MAVRSRRRFAAPGRRRGSGHLSVGAVAGRGRCPGRGTRPESSHDLDHEDLASPVTEHADAVVELGSGQTSGRCDHHLHRARRMAWFKSRPSFGHAGSAREALGRLPEQSPRWPTRRSAAASGSTLSPTSGCSPWRAAVSITRRPSRPRSSNASSAASRPRPTHPRPRTWPGRRGPPQNGAVGGQQRNRDGADTRHAARGGWRRSTVAASAHRSVLAPADIRVPLPQALLAWAAAIIAVLPPEAAALRPAELGEVDLDARTACARSRRPFDDDGRSVKSQAEPKPHRSRRPKRHGIHRARPGTVHARCSRPGSRSSWCPARPRRLGVVAVAAMPTRPPGWPAPAAGGPGTVAAVVRVDEPGFTPEETKTAYLLTASRGPARLRSSMTWAGPS